MSKHNLRFLRNEVIEQVTAQRIREYESKGCTVVTLPVPVEQIIEQVLGLDFDWDEIEEIPGEQILAGLDAVNRKILVNEKHINLFEEKLGLYRSTIGHEAGHYDIAIDQAKLLHPSLPGMELKPVIAHRHAKKSDRTIAVLLDRAMTDPRAAKLLKKITDGHDTPDQKSAVDRYQSSLLMPEWLMREAAANLVLTSWSVLYELANTAQVTISNLVVRLRRLDLIYMRDGDKTIYRSRDEFTGQKTLF